MKLLSNDIISRVVFGVSIKINRPRKAAGNVNMQGRLAWRWRRRRYLFPSFNDTKRIVKWRRRSPQELSKQNWAFVSCLALYVENRFYEEVCSLLSSEAQAAFERRTHNCCSSVKWWWKSWESHPRRWAITVYCRLCRFQRFFKLSSSTSDFWALCHDDSTSWWNVV